MFTKLFENRLFDKAIAVPICKWAEKDNRFVTDWDGSDATGNAPRLTVAGHLMIGVCFAGMFVCLPFVLAYDWAHGGGRRG